MNAEPLLSKISKALQASNLEAVLIGNSAAALLGAPVTTLDFYFMFRDTPTNRVKLKKFAKLLNAIVMRPYYPVSALFRVVNDDIGLQVDFMPKIHGVTSFASLRSRSSVLESAGWTLQVADLEDIIKSKRAAGRDRDKAVIRILEKTRDEAKKIKK
jgi:hypothetical protein